MSTVGHLPVLPFLFLYQIFRVFCQHRKQKVVISCVSTFNTTSIFWGVFKHCHIAASSFHPLRIVLVGLDSWLGCLIALFPLHSYINSFLITVSKPNFLFLFVKSDSVYLHPIQSSSTDLLSPSSMTIKLDLTPFLSLLQAQALFYHSIYILKAITLLSLKWGCHISRNHFCSSFDILWFLSVFSSYLIFLFTVLLKHILTNTLNKSPIGSIT